MKKLMIAAAIAAVSACANADVAWSWWLDNKTATPDVSFGIASKCLSVDALELSALYSASPVRNGLQFTVFGINDSAASCALQLAPWYNGGDDPCVQLAFVNNADDPCVQLGFLNISDASAFQLGFLNFNKKGFLPVFPFINFNPSVFD
ncbi:MAG: hypothetical protein ILO34_01880 [Kiritimatiellae bacterium]|nr:hypothetical protein [Kiritimatiellia bacterium]